VGIELEFTKESAEIPGYGTVNFEWSLQDVFEVHRLVFHFFLGGMSEDHGFKAALQEAGESSISDPTIVETFYTEEFDGHDLVLTGVRPYAKTAIKTSVVHNLAKKLGGK